MVHTAPTTAAIRNNRTNRSQSGIVPNSSGPIPAITADASRNCPSMPRFQIPALKTKIRPQAMSSRGAIRMTVSCQAESSTPPDQMLR